jgi:hypothetical protein
MKFTKGDILVPHGAEFPNGAVVVDGYDDGGRLLAHPFGGGLQYVFDTNATSRYRVADEAERGRALFRRAKLSLMDSEVHFTGWTNGEKWNGWAKPHFELAEGHRLIEWLKGDRSQYDAAQGAFVTISQDGEAEVWAASSIAITDGSSIKAYPIGAGAWCWDELEE